MSAAESDPPGWPALAVVIISMMSQRMVAAIFLSSAIVRGV